MKMKRDYFPVALLVVFMLAACKNEKENKCSAFKTGKFLFHSELDNTITIIERNDSIQIETIQNTGSIFKAKISWTDDCNYDLIYSDSRLQGGDSLKKAVLSKPMKTKILETAEDYYIFQTSIAGEGILLIDTFRIIR